MLIPGPVSWIRIFFHPGSRRSKKSTGSRNQIRKTDFLSILALLDLLLGQIDVEKRQKNSCRLRYLANDSLQIALPNVRLQILGKPWLLDLKCRKNKHLVIDTWNILRCCVQRINFIYRTVFQRTSPVWGHFSGLIYFRLMIIIFPDSYEYGLWSRKDKSTRWIRKSKANLLDPEPK